MLVNVYIHFESMFKISTPEVRVIEVFLNVNTCFHYQVRIFPVFQTNLIFKIVFCFNNCPRYYSCVRFIKIYYIFAIFQTNLKRVLLPVVCNFMIISTHNFFFLYKTVITFCHTKKKNLGDP